MTIQPGAKSEIDRLSNEDTQILKLGRGAIRGHTCKLLMLEPVDGGALPSADDVRNHIESRLYRAPRFRKHLKRTPLGVANPVWVDDPQFDIANHVTRVPLEGELSRGQLTELVGDLMAEPLSLNRPLWHMAVVDRIEGGATALVWRVHHALADGTMMLRLAADLLWDSGSLDSRPAWRPAAAPTATQLLSSGLADRASSWRARRWRYPSLKSVSATEAVVVRELRPGASTTRLAARPCSARTVAFVSLPLEASRRAGKAISEHITINDVVLAILAGAVGRWLGSDAAIRVKVPVSLHQRDEANVSNHNSCFFVDLPVGEPDPVRRVQAINQETQERKLAHDAETLYHLGSHPAIAHWEMSPHVFTFNVSNVPGPKDDVFVMGARLRELYALAEIAKHHALRVAVISAAGSLFVGLCADREAVQDLDALAAEIERASEELLAVVT